MPLSDADRGRLRWWLEVQEWEPDTAAFMLVGLDPDATYEAVGREDWHFGWLNGIPEEYRHFGKPSSNSFIQNVKDVIRRMRRITAHANAARVRTPHQWLRYAVSAAVEPHWLKAAFADAELRGLLPPDLPAAKETISAENVSRKDHQRAAGRARHRAMLGPLHEKARQFWERHSAEKWPMAEFARRFMDEHSITEKPTARTVTEWFSDLKRGKENRYT